MTSIPSVQVRKLRPDAQLPRYMTAGAAGMDLSCAADAPIELRPGEPVAVGTGLAIAIPDGFEGQVRPRSGNALKRAITVANAPGTIDSDYRGEVKVILVNLGSTSQTIESGERIAQLVIAPVVQVRVEPVEQLGDTDRGGGGFGSTG